MRCPICKKPVEKTDGETAKYSPFCSDRCRLIDLGRWLDGKYQIPVDDDQDAPQFNDDPDPDSPPEHRAR
jgi:endogenous inhibitor of DNA gyrase (YacG/DUF329 family)